MHGIGIPRSVTLIVGGGYRGKSTLLSSLVTGAYDRVADDGRELVAVDEAMAALRAEDGRAIISVDISPFISGLPSDDDIARFSTANASGSTSRATGLIETLGSDARALLIDEDTFATNFMTRGKRTRRLVPDDRESVTPLVVRVRGLWEDHGVSMVIVAGGSGAFIGVTDIIIAMDMYIPYGVTERVRDFRESATPAEPSPTFAQIYERFLQADFPVDGGRGGYGGCGGHGRDDRGHGTKPPKPPRARGLESIQVGRDNLDLCAVGQLADSSQTEATARILGAVMKQFDGRTDPSELIQREYDNFCHSFFDATAEFVNFGHLAEPHFQEVAAAINRFRLLRQWPRRLAAPVLPLPYGCPS